MELDKQQVEVIGRNIVTNQLLREDIEVAEPVRDRGIDLIAYLRKEEGQRFHARPLQLKVASDRDFSVYKKYDEFNDMVVVYVWRIAYEDGPEIYALTTQETLDVAEQRGWTETNTWANKDQYNDTTVTGPTQNAVNPYEIEPGGWCEKLFGGEGRQPSSDGRA
jgi:hypothetical protein